MAIKVHTKAERRCMALHCRNTQQKCRDWILAGYPGEGEGMVWCACGDAGPHLLSEAPRFWADLPTALRIAEHSHDAGLTSRLCDN